MANRKLDLEKFLDAIPQEQLVEYFKRKAQEHGRESLISSLETADVIKYLDLPEDQEIKDNIREDFIQINDLCERTTGLLVDEVNRRRIPMEQNENREALAMRIFLQYKDVFEYAHDRYYLFRSSGRISEYQISAARIDLTDGKERLLNESVRRYFANSAKGGNSIIRYHKKDDRLMIAVVHGAHKRAVSSWSGDDMRDTRTILYRPAKEDILEFVFAEQRLYVKASGKKDQEMYIAAFADHIVGDKTQALRRDRDDTFDLSILQESDFRFEMDEVIQSVSVTEAKVSALDDGNSFWIYHGLDGLSVLKMHPMNSGPIRHVRFLFRLKIDGKMKKVTFEITPPNASDLNKKKYAAIIRRYLERIGIKRAQTSARPMVEDAAVVV